MIPKKLQNWKPEKGFPFKCGLEIHTQLLTKHKLFSQSVNVPNCAPNANTSFFDLAFPGTFPKLNPEALLLALKAAAALDASISTTSSFDRKHYFYFDQPLGYQITQRFRPLARGGHLQLSKDYDDVLSDKLINIEQLQLEQDTAKLNYDDYDSLVSIDLNRANVPLIELVTKPDFENLLQVRAFIKKYLGLVSHLGICSGDLENGAMRCDVNVSVAGGDRVEVKNLSSTSEVMAAAAYEYKRQVAQLKESIPVEQETRSWTGTKTVRTRSKEDAVDYRYVPDTELPFVHLDPSIADLIRAQLPEFPETVVRRLRNAPYGLEKKYAKFLVESPLHLEYYYKLHSIIVGEHKQPSKVVNNWFVHELLGAFNKLGLSPDFTMLPAEKYAALILLVQNKEVTSTSAKLLLLAMLQPSEEIAEMSVEEMVDHYKLRNAAEAETGDLKTAVEEICKEIIEENQDAVEKIKAGKHLSIKFLVGIAMRTTQGKVDPKLFDETFKNLIYNE
ncbi:hypothetical protein PUMCH_001095 [Australozyma saopauloensis]|uniref:Glutamyl-tRNA(Gln) amidotransferase subunit B, mitochondrial n=1 Tax=Australozyma saopauloensis TaxID=291208 RepID=A0AAX4H5I6_9ASCO|nr:hypothetical protein PUMCH_001095 [[Candida] saopauloensis]